MGRFGVLPPAMGDLSGEAVMLYPGSSDERKPLREALPQAIAKIRYLSDLAASDCFAEGRGGNNDNGTDGGNDGGRDGGNGGGRDDSPLPRAS
jgi:hypothetical protein